MRYRVVLSKGDFKLAEYDQETSVNNNFSEAAANAVRALFASVGHADNVTCFRVFDDGRLADEHFFYGEKG